MVDWSFADEGDGNVSQGREVAGGTDGTGLGDDWGDPGVEHRREGFGKRGPCSGMATGERGGEQQHHAADHFGLHGSADSGGVGSDEVTLQRAEIFGGDSLAGQGAETGVDSVVGEAIAERGLDDRAGCPHVLDGLRADGDPLSGASDGDKIGDGQGLAVQSQMHGER